MCETYLKALPRPRITLRAFRVALGLDSLERPRESQKKAIGALGLVSRA